MMTETEGSSNLLLPEENQMICGMIRQGHQKNTALALAVVKLYLSVQGEWKEKVIGAGTLTKDFSRKSYFIQIFDVQQRQKVLEVELIMEVNYSNPDALFHTFKWEDSLAGLSFVDQGEATNFWNVIQNTMERKRTSMELSQGNKQVNHESGFVASSCGQQANSMNEDPMVQQMNNLRSYIQAAREANMFDEVSMLESNFMMLQKEFKRQQEDATGSHKMEKGKRPKVRREDIGAPRNPVHKSGMRVAAGGDLEVVGNSDLLDPVLLKVFNVLGLDPGKIEAATLEKVKEVAAKNGVYETYKTNTSEREKKKDLRRMSAYQSKYPSMPPPPSRGNPGSTDPTRFAKRVKKSFPLPSFPPPPVPKKKCESVGDPSEAAASVSSSGRPKPVEEDEEPKPVSGRDNLLGDIRKGVLLKRVDESESRTPSVKMDDEEDIRDVLKKALELINQAKHSFDEGSDSDGDNGDW